MNNNLSKIERKSIWKHLNKNYSVFKQNVHKTFPWRKILVGMIIMAVIIYCLHLGSYDLSGLWKFFKSFEFFTHFGPVKHSATRFTANYVIWKSISLMLTTIWIAWLGSFVGSLLSLPFAFIASKTTMKKKWIYTSVRIMFSIIRSLPPILFAYFFSYLFLPDLSGILTIMILVWTVMTKWIYEELDSIDDGPFITMRAFGATRWESFYRGLLPQIMPKFVSLTFYAFEMSVRFSAVLGIVGIVGIGTMFSLYQGNMDYWGRLALVILVIITVVILIEMINYLIKRYVINFKFKDYSKEFKMKKFADDKAKVNFVLKKPRKTWLPWLVLFILISSLTVMGILNVELGVRRNTSVFYELLRKLAHPKWDSITDFSDPDKNAIISGLKLLGYMVISLVFSIIIALPIGLLASKNISGKIVSPFFKLLLIIIRSVPAYVYALMLYITVDVNKMIFAGIIALAIHGIGMMGKLISEAADNVDKDTLESSKAFGMGYFSKIRYIIWSEIKPVVLTTFMYRIEINFKQAIIFGALGNIFIFTFHLANYISNPLYFDRLAPYLLVTITIVLFVETLSNLISTKIKKGYIFRERQLKFNEKHYDQVELYKKRYYKTPKGLKPIPVLY